MSDSKQDSIIETDVRCKLCGRSIKPHFKARGYWIYRCSHCCFEQVLIDGGDDKIQYEASYFDNSKYRDIVAMNLEHKRRLSIIRRYATAKDNVVDYGCATGEFVDYSNDYYFTIGCDVSLDAVGIAKKKYPKYQDRFFSADEFLDSNEIYDIICLWDVIEHIEYPSDLISKLKDKIKDNGYIIMSTPDIGAMFARITKAMWPFMTPPEHLVFFTKRSMAYLAKKNGLEMVDWSAKGKWANVGFILYKFNRVSRFKIPQVIINSFKKGWLSKLRVYVPTHDIQYVIMRKPQTVNE